MMNNNAITLEALKVLIDTTEMPVILLEGRRSIPEEEYAMAVAVAGFLAAKFPKVRFRSGNATGSDEAFSKGIAAVDSSRLQVVAPYRNHRKKARFEGAAYQYPEVLSPDQVEQIVAKTIFASPKCQSL